MRDYLEVEMKSGKWLLITAIDTVNRTCTAIDKQGVELLVNVGEIKTPLDELYFRSQNPFRGEILLLDKDSNREFEFVNHLGKKLRGPSVSYVKIAGGWGTLREIRTDAEGEESVVSEHFLNTLTAPFNATCSLKRGKKSQTFDTFEEALDFFVEGAFFKTINGINTGFSNGTENSGRNPNKLSDFDFMSYVERSE
jgi:hypothetical protein